MPFFRRTRRHESESADRYRIGSMRTDGGRTGYGRPGAHDATAVHAGPAPSLWDLEPDLRSQSPFADPPPLHRRPPNGEAVRVFGGAEGLRRFSALKVLLDNALDDWWQVGDLPTPELLRDGLYALEAGRLLDEAQRTLLLRTALMYRRGMVTALRYQTDPERTASVLAESLILARPPLPVRELARLRAEDSHSSAWVPALRRMLQDEATAGIEPGKSQAKTALAQLQSARPLVNGRVLDAGDELIVEGEGKRQVRWSWLVPLLLLLLVVGGIGGYLWLNEQNRGQDLVNAPGGLFTVSDPATPGATLTLTLEPFAIERTEVTNAAYRRCVERGACPPPVRTGSTLWPNYYLDPSFAGHPVLNVTLAMAESYCGFVGRRLPTAFEWEVAAGWAPDSGRFQRFPWGDSFNALFVNSAENGNGDTMAAGSFHPSGSSILGAADMAGNVAEWTLTRTAVAPVQAAVKGGSFLDSGDGVAVTAAQMVEVATAAPSIGFRCATSRVGDVPGAGN
jgi:formylglycine-generating enzyme required for sulfatase activity